MSDPTQTLLNRVQVDALTKEQFAAYAKDKFGISLDDRKKKGEMVAAFEAAKGEYGPDEQDPPVIKGTLTETDGSVRGVVDDWRPEADTRRHKRRWVTINPSSEPDGEADVFLSVNGHSFQCKRGIPVQIPEAHFQVLKDAKQSIYAQETVRGEIKKTKRKVLSYSYIDHGYEQPEFDAEEAV